MASTSTDLFSSLDCNVFVCVFFFQMKQQGNKPVVTQKIANLAASPTFTSPSSTPVTIATRTMKSLWRNVGDLR